MSPSSSIYSTYILLPGGNCQQNCYNRPYDSVWQRHVAAGDERSQRFFGQTRGSANPSSPPQPLPLGWVDDRWVSHLSKPTWHTFRSGWSGFCAHGFPCLLLIRRRCVSLDPACVFVYFMLKCTCTYFQMSTFGIRQINTLFLISSNVGILYFTFL